MTGRPPVGPRSTRVLIRIDQALVDRLDEHAEQTGTTRSELLRRGAELVLSRHATEGADQ